jgi:hypothetical protein
MIRSSLKRLFAPTWEYGTCNGIRARTHKSGAVQFVIWKAGEHGHTEDYWVDFNSYWWPDFKVDE